MSVHKDRPQLVFGISGPLGTRIRNLSRALADELKTFGYSAQPVRVSDLLRLFPDNAEQPGPAEDSRIEALQNAANDLRSRLEDGAILARAAVAEIRKWKNEKI